MNGLHVDAGSMNSQGVNTVKLAEDLNSEINSLNANIESLMGIWRGIAAQQFKQVVDTQVVNLRDFEKLLNTMGQNIVKGATLFDETEQDNANRASNLF